MKIKDMLRTLKFEGGGPGFHQLYTKWGEELDPAQVLQEYPRPQLRRDNHTILNGYWNYAITASSERPVSFEGRILVPFSPESVLSGVNRQLKPEEYLWYSKSIYLGRKYPGRRCILHFGAVDQYCELYINRQKATEHMGGYLPFSVDITKLIGAGENELTLMVTDRSDTSYHSRGKQLLKRGGIFYTAQSGIWQTVWLEWVPEDYIHSLKLTPNVEESSLSVEIHMNQEEYANQEAVYHVDIYAEGKLLQSMFSRFPSFKIPIPKMILWSPERPFLYDLELWAGEDRVESYFAMRKFEVKEDSNGIPRIFLNNEPYFQNGLLDQGYWPDGLYTAPSDEAMIFDIQSAKDLGFQMLRKHIKIEPLRWYYHCDRLGMLVWQDMVNGGEAYNQLIVAHLPTLFSKFRIKDKHYGLFSRKNAEGRREWTRECIETVNHLYNCPCIAVWVPFNEAWGQFDAKATYELVKGLDPTRLVDHASGWYDQKAGDFMSIHNYFHKLKVRKEKRPVVFSEFGGYGCYVPEHSYSFLVFGYRIYLGREQLNEAYQKLYQEEIAKLIQKGLSAAVYTQLSDVEDEVNGLFTYDRKVCKVTPLSLNQSINSSTR